MNKQDVSNIRSFQEVERRLKGIENLGNVNEKISAMERQIYEVNNEVNSILNAVILNLKDELKGQSDISLWFFSGIPTLTNEPYINWTTPADHYGDIYYDVDTGYVYQFKEPGEWQRNYSKDLTQAMALTNAQLQDKNNEKKVFFVRPTPGDYSPGDWWVKGDGTLFICLPIELNGNPDYDFASSQYYLAQVVDEQGASLKRVDDKQERMESTLTAVEQEASKISSLAERVSISETMITENSTKIEQTSEQVEIKFTDLTDLIQAVDGRETEHHNEFIRYIRFIDGNIVLGEENNPFQTIISNEKISFLENNVEVAYLSNNKLYITNAEVIESLQLGKFAFTPRDNGSLTFGKVE